MIGAVIVGLYITRIFRNSLRTPRMVPTLYTEGSKIDLSAGICNRKCWDKKDKALALQAVLQKLSTSQQPILGPSSSLEELYRELTARIIETTGTLQLLLPAALKNFDRCPSWVPDWSAGFDPFWIGPWNATPESKSLWRWHATNTTSNVLVVRGRHLCNITSCVNYQKIGDRFLRDAFTGCENQIHLENIQASLSFWQAIRYRGWTETQIRDVLGMREAKNSRQLLLWATFFQFVANQPAEVVVHFFTDNSSKSVLRVFSTQPKLFFILLSFLWSFPSFLFARMGDIQATQISVSNHLARTGKTVFITNDIFASATDDYDYTYISIIPYFFDRWRRLMRDKTFDHYFRDEKTEHDVEDGKGKISRKHRYYNKKSIGVSTDKVKPGDQVVLISGLRTPLILRQAGLSNRLVSPALVPIAMRGSMWNKEWHPTELEEIFIS